MAIFYCQSKIIGRSSGRSSVGASAYRSGEKIKNERDGKIHDYRKKEGVVYSEIMLSEDAPECFQNRAILWNEVEQVERRKDSQLAREIQIALPKELNVSEQIKLTQKYVKNNFVSHGMIADVSIHDKGDGNPHAHIMLTTRDVTKDGFGEKNRNWNNKDLVPKWRESWAKEVNQVLKEQGINEHIDHRSYKEQGIERIPQIHMGHEATAMEKRGIETYKGNINRKIAKQNIKLEKLEQYLDTLKQEIVAQERPKGTEGHRVAQERPKGAENIEQYTPKEWATHLYGKERVYLDLLKEYNQLMDKKKENTKFKEQFIHDKEIFPEEYNKLQKILKERNNIKNEIKELEKKATFFRNNKKEIELKTREEKDLLNSYNTGKREFEDKWGIKADLASVKKGMQILKRNQNTAQRYIDEALNKLEVVEEKKGAAYLEYKTDWFIAGEISDKGEIEESFQNLQDKEVVRGNRSTKNAIFREQLKNISLRDKTRILKNLETTNPKMANKFIEQLKSTIDKAIPTQDLER